MLYVYYIYGIMLVLLLELQYSMFLYEDYMVYNYCYVFIFWVFI